MFSLFDDVIGHDELKDVLKKVAVKPGHAYLFQGQQGAGKRMLAERLAASVLYSLEEQQKLDRARLIEHLEAHPDFIRVVRADGTKELSVRQIRELVERTSLSSARGGKIVVVIEEADSLNEEACNAMLKTVEEPKAALLFLLLAERPNRLPATLRSRLTPLSCERVSKVTLVQWLQATHHVTDVKRANEIAEASLGCPGRAVAILQDLAGWQTRRERVNAIAEQLLHGNLGTRLAAIDRLTTEAERADDPSEAWQILLEACGRAIQNDWMTHPLETVRMARGLIHASRLAGGSLSPRFALEWNGTLPFVPEHSLPRVLDTSSLFSL